MNNNTFEGLKSLEVEVIENGICLETVRFNKINNSMEFNTSVETDKGTYPVYAKSSSELEVFYFNGYVKMNIPKLMPFFDVRKPYDATVRVDKSILVNNDETRPNILNTIGVCNYIRVKPPSVLMTSSGLNYGDNVVCVFPNKNIKRPSFLPI